MSNPTQNVQNINSAFLMQLSLQTSHFPPKSLMISSVLCVLATRPANLLVLLSIFKLILQDKLVHMSCRRDTLWVEIPM
jgi:hypothetical protein